MNQQEPRLFSRLSAGLNPTQDLKDPHPDQSCRWTLGQKEGEHYLGVCGRCCGQPIHREISFTEAGLHESEVKFAPFCSKPATREEIHAAGRQGSWNWVFWLPSLVPIAHLGELSEFLRIAARRPGICAQFFTEVFAACYRYSAVLREINTELRRQAAAFYSSPIYSDSELDVNTDSEADTDAGSDAESEADVEALPVPVVPIDSLRWDFPFFVNRHLFIHSQHRHVNTRDLGGPRVCPSNLRSRIPVVCESEDTLDLTALPKALTPAETWTLGPCVR